jgi:hypothetical protein
MVERRKFGRRIAQSIWTWLKTRLGKGTIGLAVIVGVLAVGQYYDFTLSQLLNPSVAAKFPKIGQMLEMAWSWVEELHPVFWVMLGLIAVFEAAYRINRHFINRARRDAQLVVQSNAHGHRGHHSSQRYATYASAHTGPPRSSPGSAPAKRLTCSRSH